MVTRLVTGYIIMFGQVFGLALELVRDEFYLIDGCLVFDMFDEYLRLRAVAYGATCGSLSLIIHFIHTRSLWDMNTLRRV